MDVIRIENRCNQHCLFCGANPENKGDYTFDFADVKRKIDQAGKDDIIEISGGEPTLNPILPKILLYAAKTGRRVSLQSNATRFASEPFAAAMVKAGLTHVFVSLHAPDAHQSDALTRAPGSFDLTVAGVRNLQALGVHVSLNLVICEPNKHRLLDYVHFVRDTFEKKPVIVFSYINPFHNAWKTPKLIPEIGTFREHLHAALVEGERLGFEMHVPDICGMPLCYLNGVERFADKYTAVKKGWPFKPHPQKSKGEACVTCIYEHVCDGLWDRYVELFGFDGLRPVTVAPGDLPSESLANRSCSSHEKPTHHQPMRDTAFLVGPDCPNNCVFCNEGGGASPRKVMSLDDARRLLSKTNPHWVFLSGGEPTRAPNLLDYIQLAKNHGVQHITLVSNGSGLVDPATVEAYVRAGVDEIRLSVHGDTAELHDRQTRKKGSFSNILAACRNIANLKTRYPLKSIALVVVNKLNQNRLVPIVEQMHRLAFDKIGLGIIEPARNAETAFYELVPRYSEVAAAIEDCFASIERSGLRQILDIFVDSLPPCLVGNDIPLGERSVITTLSEADGALFEMSRKRGKAYGDICRTCSLRDACEGVWEAYVARYGWDEFGER